jgi:hypothetical protein
MAELWHGQQDLKGQKRPLAVFGRCGAIARSVIPEAATGMTEACGLRCIGCITRQPRDEMFLSAFSPGMEQ